METFDFKSSPKWRGHTKFAFQVFTLAIVATVLCSNLYAFAAAPVISTAWSIEYGAQEPVLFVQGVNFSSENNKFDFTVDVGTTGLEYDSVAFINVKLMRFIFHESAKAGTITIQANPSAFSPTASQTSNIISIVILEPLLPQIIEFTTPKDMVVREPDQIPEVTSTSGLTVSLISSTPSICTIDFLKFHPVAPGTCSITASQGGNSDFTPANPVTRIFTVWAPPSSTTEPTSLQELATNLGSAPYYPKNTIGLYISALVAAEDKSPKNTIFVKLFVPPSATKTPVIFLISSFSSDKENSDGYFVARIKSIAADGSVVSKMNGVIELVLPPGALDAVPAWSLDSRTWHKLRQINSGVLPPDLHAGYFVNNDGHIVVFSDYLMLFGFRKIQAPLYIISPISSVRLNQQVQVQSTGGSGDGDLVFISRTLDVCNISASGVLTGLKGGKCIISAHKNASGAYLDARSSAITLIVNSESTVLEDLAPHQVDSDLCHELSHSVQRASSLVIVNLCNDDAGKIATLEIGTKSKSGSWSYSQLMKLKLDKNGVGYFILGKSLKNGQILRVSVNKEFKISVNVYVN